MQVEKTLKLIAAVEALKGLLALAAASGALLLIHKDLHTLAGQLVEHLHLNPAAHYPSIFISVASQLQNGEMLLIALGAIAYSLLRFIEAYGLFYQTTWAEWLAAGSGILYLPFEGVEVLHKFSGISVAILLINLAIVGVMLIALRQHHQKQNG